MWFCYVISRRSLDGEKVILYARGIRIVRMAPREMQNAPSQLK